MDFTLEFAEYADRYGYRLVMELGSTVAYRSLGQSTVYVSADGTWAENNASGKRIRSGKGLQAFRTR